MTAVLKAIPIVLALGAVGLVVVERGRVSELQTEVERLRRLVVEVDEEPVLPPLPRPQPVSEVVEDEPEAAPERPDDVASLTELRAVRVRLNDAERRISLATLVLEGLTARPAEADTQAEALATELLTLRADVDDLLAARDQEAESREEEALESDDAVAGAVEPPPPPPTLGERWRGLREAHDRAWMDGVSAAAQLTPQQSDALQGLVGDLRASQEATLQEVWQGRKSLVDAQIELDELERSAEKRLRQTMSLSQLKAYRRRLVTYPHGGLTY